jgi:hypothetical protein
LPFNVRAEKSPGNPGSHPAGTVLPLASVRGRVVEETSRELIAEGAVTITGYAQSLSYPIGLDGQFEISRLFPGSYDLEVQVFGHTRTRQTVVVGEEDVRLELTPRKLY